MIDSDDGRTHPRGHFRGLRPRCQASRRCARSASWSSMIRTTSATPSTARCAGPGSSCGWRRAGGRRWTCTGGIAAAIDVVVLDVRMPGMDGPQTLAALREVAPRVRCCFLTGDFGVYTEAQLLAMGAGAVLYKPARPEKLIGAVRLLANGAAVGPVAG